MALHLFRPADPLHSNLSPSWKSWCGVLFVALARVLNCLRQMGRDRRARRLLAYLLLLVGLVGQLVLLFVAAYLIDLSLSLMELWADLARKHLELTL